MKIAAYRPQVRLPCQIAILNGSQLRTLFETAKAGEMRARRAILIIDGFLDDATKEAKCIGCDASFSGTEIEGFAVAVSAADDGLAVCAGICGDCMSMSQEKLKSCFCKAMSKDQVADVY